MTSEHGGESLGSIRRDPEIVGPGGAGHSVGATQVFGASGVGRGIGIEGREKGSHAASALSEDQFLTSCTSAFRVAALMRPPERRSTARAVLTEHRTDPRSSCDT